MLLGAPVLAQQGGVPWVEHSDLSISPYPAPTTAERLARAEVLLVHDQDLVPALGGYWLEVHPWTTLHGGPDDWPLCYPTEPFYGQPTPGSGCSGFLVGPNLVVTAGHCIAPPEGMDPWVTDAPYPCDDRYVVFGFADQLVTPPDGRIWLDDSQVIQCLQVPVDTYLAPETDLLTTTPLGADWALLELDGVAVGRLPLIVERFPQTEAGDPALILGHPARLPMKAEITQVESTGGNVLAHALAGSSGRALINLETGKAFSNLTNTSLAWVTLKGGQGGPQCANPCFECPGRDTFGTSSSAWLGQLQPPLGLQMVAPVGNVMDYYGPPTTPSDYETWTTTLSVAPDSLPEGILAIDWGVQQEDRQPNFFEVVNGPSNGSLAEGESTTIVMAPAAWIVDEPGLYEKVVPVFDWTFETRDPILHRAHVGVDGFTVSPGDALDGEWGLGVPHGETREHTLSNQWIVPQQLTITPIMDPPDPPPPLPPGDWLLVDGEPDEITVALPPKDSEIPEPAPIVSIDGSGMSPGVYTGRVVYRSDDSGSPPFAIATEVRFDHCREAFWELQDPPLPYFIDIAPGEEHVQNLTVSPTGGTIVADVDLIADFDVILHGPPEYEEWLISPDGTSVLLKDSDDDPQIVFDQDTAPPPSGQTLNDFNGDQSPGIWKLRIYNVPTNPRDVRGTLERFEVRLHHQGAPPCEP